jgi:hypothetical protein
MSRNNLPPDSDIVGLDRALAENFAKDVPMPIQMGEPTERMIKLTWSASAYFYNQTDGIRVRLEIAESENMPSKIFAYLLQPLVPGAESRIGAFDHVCSPSDLEEYPEDSPLPDIKPEWFRLDYVDVIVRSRTEAHAFIRDVAQDVYYLKNTLDTTDRIFPAGEITFGGITQSSSSSSSSSGGYSSSSSSSSGGYSSSSSSSSGG